MLQRKKCPKPVTTLEPQTQYISALPAGVVSYDIAFRFFTMQARLSFFDGITPPTEL
jgi:hypothetical protein